MVVKNKKDIQFEQPSDLLLLVNRYLIVIISLIIIIISVSGYLFLLKPKIDDIGVSEESTTDTEQRRIDNEVLLGQIRDLEAEYYHIINNRQEDLDFLTKMVPVEPQVAEIFLMSDILSKKHNFQLDNIDLNSEAKIGPDNRTAQGTEPSEADNRDTVDKLLASTNIKAATINLSISRKVKQGDETLGSDIYEDFKDYLADLENNIRLLDVQSIIFDGIDSEPTINLAEEEEKVYTFTLILVTYYK